MPRRLYFMALMIVVLTSLQVGMAIHAIAQRIDTGTRVRGLDLASLGAPFLSLAIYLAFLLRWPPGSKQVFLGLKPE